MAVQAVGRTRPAAARDQAIARIAKRSSTNGHAKAQAQTSSKAETGLVEENAAAARKQGVHIKTWQRGVRQGKPVTTFYVVVAGQRLRAISGNFDSLAAARKAVQAAGLKVVDS